MNPKPNSKRLYLFFFAGIPKPVKIVSTSKQNALAILNNMMPNLPEIYQRRVVVDERVESLIHGVSFIISGGVKYLWHKEKGWIMAKNQQ